MPDELYYKTAEELGVLLERRALSAVDLLKAVIGRVKAVEEKVGAFLSCNEKDALAQAQASDERRARGEALGPLDGIPVAVKDVIAVKGQPLTCASRMLENFISPYDASCIARLKKTGAVLWGRLNMDEFAMGSSTENSAFKVTSNPWDLARVPGGSSGGGAAALAAGETILALGSDTGGSIRQPAAWCGVAGLKPTYGLVSRYGLVAYASSLDQIGPMGRSAGDLALLLQGIAGHDPLDSTSLKTDIPDYRAATEKRKPWKLGVPKEYFGEGLHPEIRAAIEQAIEFYKSGGCEIAEISLPHTDLAIPVYYIIATAEASSNLARYDGVRYTRRSPDVKDAVDLYFQTRGDAFGREVKRRVILGTYALSSGYYDAYYLRAQKVRTLIRNGFMRAFEASDAILTPVTPAPPFKKGEKVDDPLAMYLGDVYTISANLAGLPAAAIPCGFMKNPKLPIGLQIIGRPFQESVLLALARRFGAARGRNRQRPEL